MAYYPFVLNGVSYDQTSFDNFAYVTGVPNSMSDLVRECLLLHEATSVTSTTIGTGAKNLTISAGRAFKAGDFINIASSAAPQTNRMWGTVTSYNFGSGALVANITGVAGAGTFASWLISIGGCQSAFGTTGIVAVDNGGTGFPASTFAPASAFLGINSPAMHMQEIYEDFVGNVGGFNSGDNTVRVAQPPWFSYGERATNKWTDPNTNTTLDAGTYLLTANVTSSVLYGRSAFLIYGNTGFVHGGRGAMTWETSLWAPGTAGYGFRCGLKAYGSGNGPNIFSYGGIGFAAEELVNNGRYRLICGKNGVIQTINTGILPNSSGIDKLRFEVDHDGRMVDFFINGNLVNSIEAMCPTDNVNNLLQPAYEIRCMRNDGLAVTPMLYIESMQFRKYLLR